MMEATNTPKSDENKNEPVTYCCHSDNDIIFLKKRISIMKK